jgi:hypothetical protein
MNQIQSDTPAAQTSRHPAEPLPMDVQLAAYNAAFIELGLRFRWDAAMFEWLCGIECERTRVARYIEDHHAHLLKAYDADFLSGLVFERKNEYLRAMGRLN